MFSLRIAAAIAVLFIGTAEAKHRSPQTLITCNERGCSDSHQRPTEARYVTIEDGRVVGGRPSGCPHAYCGCSASLYVFGRIIPELNLASNWIRKFPRTSPAPGMAAARSHHVMILISHEGGSDWLVHDGNSGNHLTRDHVRSISGYVIVNPLTRMTSK